MARRELAKQEGMYELMLAFLDAAHSIPEGPMDPKKHDPDAECWCDPLPHVQGKTAIWVHRMLQ